MNNKEKIKELIGESRVGIFVTQNNGRLFSRPIAYADLDDDHNVWFFTDVNSEKIDDINHSEQVNFSFANQSNNTYVSLSGTAEIINNETIIDEKWSFMMKAWFPEGKKAERLALVKVTPDSVQYWDGSTSRVILLHDMAKALLTGKSYVEVANSENETIKY